ncbi:MAG TPA: hypothetical protein VD815_01650 [Candidatus Saccharimonadales bacterium]|nr:hypothetical protein [Candidatus Saccharimonadales bacterium]
MTLIFPLAFSVFAMLFASQIFNYNIFGQNNNAPSDSSILGIPKNISGITCDKTEHLLYHNHTMLIIKNQDQNITIPSDIGIIPNDCIFWLHTHDDSGIIHVESPNEISFSLGQFLRVWNSFDNASIIEDILQNKSKADISILLENGTVVDSVNDIVDIPLQNNAIVTLDLTNNATR